MVTVSNNELQLLIAGEYNSIGSQAEGSHLACFSVQLDMLEGCLPEALEEGCLDAGRLADTLF